MTVLYASVEQIYWPDDELGERNELLARVSYLAWVHARRWEGYPESAFWEERVAALCLAQESVKAFLALPAEARSEGLNRRFLGDPAVLLATCVRLRGLVETAPLVCITEADLALRWVSANGRVLFTGEESAYFAAELTWIVAAASKHCGRYADCQLWLDRLEQRCDEFSGAESVRARAQYLRLAVLYHLRSYQEILESLPALQEACARLGMRLSLAKCDYLKAITLKELGRDTEARRILGALRTDPHIRNERWLNALVLMGIAELEGRAGFFEAAEANLVAAFNLLRDSETPIATAQLRAVRGELLRDQGLLLEAANSYRASIAVYLTAGMAAMAAYLRIVLAETLLAAGREDEAILEIVGALPTIGESGLVREGMAAVVLLRESIRRHKVDPSALHELRAQLERMKNGGEL